MICRDCEHPCCDDCGSPMITDQSWDVHHVRLDGHVKVGGRGLCSADYQAWRFRQAKIASPEWAGARPSQRRTPVGIGSWPDKHRDVKRARS